MARIRFDENVLASVGQCIADAVRDPAKRQAFISNPSAELESAGLKAADLALVNPVAVEDQGNTVNIVLPVGVDDAKVDAGDQDYLALLGRIAIDGCQDV